MIDAKVTGIPDLRAALAGKGLADPSSMIAAIRLACELA